MLKVAGICFVIFLVIQQYISFITKVIKKPKEPKVNNTSFHDELSKLSLSTPKEVRFKNSFNKNQEFIPLILLERIQNYNHEFSILNYTGTILKKEKLNNETYLFKLYARLQTDNTIELKLVITNLLTDFTYSETFVYNDYNLFFKNFELVEN